MSTRTTVRSLATSGLVLLLGFAMATTTEATPVERPNADVGTEGRATTDADLPNDGRPIVATVIEVDEDGGRVTLDTPHGRLDLTVSRDLAGKLTPGDVVVLRLTDDEADADYPSAAPRETPKPAPNRI